MNKLISILILTSLILFSCVDPKNTLEEQPKAEILSPLPCDTMYFGESFSFKISLNDNTGLGNISFDVHNNFGHHNHGAHETCTFDPVKQSINPYSNSWIFSLPTEKNEYLFEETITLPFEKTGTGKYDTGDYHFHIYITDNEGYQVFTTRDVKILYRS